MVPLLFVGGPIDWLLRERDYGLKFAYVRVSAGGHNNIKLNPDFRGMVRPEWRADNHGKL